MIWTGATLGKQGAPLTEQRLGSEEDLELSEQWMHSQWEQM